MAYNFLETLSLVEWLILGFIGGNIMLAGTCVVQRSVKRLAEAGQK